MKNKKNAKRLALCRMKIGLGSQTKKQSHPYTYASIFNRKDKVVN